jgi:hypothetical protein
MFVSLRQAAWPGLATKKGTPKRLGKSDAPRPNFRALSEGKETKAIIFLPRKSDLIIRCPDTLALHAQPDMTHVSVDYGSRDHTHDRA